MIEFTIKTLDSTNHRFSVSDEITVEQLKEKVKDQMGIETGLQRLIFCGRVLQDEKKLAEYDVDGKVVHLVQRAPPGPETRSTSTPRHTSRSGRQFQMNPSATFNGPAEDGEALPFHLEMRRLMNLAGTPDFHVDPHQQMVLSPISGRLETARRFITEIKSSLASLRAHLANEEDSGGPASSETPIEPMDSDTAPGAPVDEPEPTFDENGEEVPSDSAAPRPANARRGSVARFMRSRHPQPRHVAALIDELVELKEQFQVQRSNYSQLLRAVNDRQDIKVPRKVARFTRFRHPQPRHLAALIDELEELNQQFQFHRRNYAELLRAGNDSQPPVYTEEERARHQRTVDLTTDLVHIFAHAYHAISDISFTVGSPRLSAEAAVTRHLIPMQAHINVISAARRPPSNATATGSNVGAGGAGGAPATQTSATAAPNTDAGATRQANRPTAPGRNTTQPTVNINIQPDPVTYQLEIETRVPISVTPLENIFIRRSANQQNQGAQASQGTQQTQNQAGQQNTAGQQSQNAQQTAAGQPNQAGQQTQTQNQNQQNQANRRQVFFDIENLFRGMGNGLGGVEVVMSMEEMSQGALGNLGNLASGNAGPLGGLAGAAGQQGVVDGGVYFAPMAAFATGGPPSAADLLQNIVSQVIRQGLVPGPAEGLTIHHAHLPQPLHQMMNVTPQAPPVNMANMTTTETQTTLEGVDQVLVPASEVDDDEDDEDEDGQADEQMSVQEQQQNQEQRQASEQPQPQQQPQPQPVPQQQQQDVPQLVQVNQMSMQQLAEASVQAAWAIRAAHVARVQIQAQASQGAQASPGSQAQASPQSQTQAGQTQQRAQAQNSDNQQRQPNIPIRRTSHAQVAMANMAYDRFLQCDSPHARRRVQTHRNEMQQMIEQRDQLRNERASLQNIETLCRRRTGIRPSQMCAITGLLNGEPSPQAWLAAFMIGISRQLYMNELLHASNGMPALLPNEFQLLRRIVRHYVHDLLSRSGINETDNAFQSVSDYLVTTYSDFINSMNMLTPMREDIDAFESIRALVRSRLPAFIASVMCDSNTDLFVARFYAMFLRLFSEMCSLVHHVCIEGDVGLRIVFKKFLFELVLNFDDLTENQNYNELVQSAIMSLGMDNLSGVIPNMATQFQSVAQFVRRVDGTMPDLPPRHAPTPMEVGEPTRENKTNTPPPPPTPAAEESAPASEEPAASEATPRHINIINPSTRGASAAPAEQTAAGSSSNDNSGETSPTRPVFRFGTGSPPEPENNTRASANSPNSDSNFRFVPPVMIVQHWGEEWVPVFTRDQQSQGGAQQRPAEPYSDGYLAGMTSRKRRCVRQARPATTLDGFMNESVREATERISTDNQAIRSAFREHMRNLAYSRAASSVDYDPARYASAARFLNGSNKNENPEGTNKENGV